MFVKIGDDSSRRLVVDETKRQNSCSRCKVRAKKDEVFSIASLCLALTVARLLRVTLLLVARGDDDEKALFQLLMTRRADERADGCIDVSLAVIVDGERRRRRGASKCAKQTTAPFLQALHIRVDSTRPLVATRLDSPLFCNGRLLSCFYAIGRDSRACRWIMLTTTNILSTITT